MIDAVVSRLHRALVQALLSRGSGALDRPVTVAEIYQDLIPYRTVRGQVGVELNADYEHALLRLLAGEGGRLRLEPASARDELARELESPNPNVGLYRKFAACDVWVDAAAADDALPPATAAPTAADAPRLPPDDAGAVAGAPPDASAFDGHGPSPHPPASAASRPRAAASSDACTFCAEPLPAGRSVRFCPFCGMDQRSRPCTRCGEVLEPGWRFCIGCGAPVDDEVRRSEP